ncbi:MAG: hypothetical protein QM652_12215 [Legionella sp.]|uniref:hypothetical protein n=1 Tax=Legionella sp. TaxID=459 RepID=UPI0039E6B8A3
MLHYLKVLFLFLYISLFCHPSSADPWFTGPILAPAGHSVPRGHTNFELYGIDAFTNAQFDNKGRAHRIPMFKSLIFNPLLTHGFTDWLDVQLSVPYTFNSTRGIDYNRLTDTSLALGIQILEQKHSKWIPDLRLLILEVFPTGKYNELNPALYGTDATGLGSYRTLIGLNLQFLKEIYESHYLRTRLFLSSLISSSVYISGISSFGGSVHTRGTVNPGIEDNIDLAFEYTLTQHWVAVMEGYYSEGQATRFNGILDILNDDEQPTVGAKQYYEFGLAPALEYNFNAHVGVIGGVWFPVQGKNTSRFMSYVLAINAYW